MIAKRLLGWVLVILLIAGAFWLIQWVVFGAIFG